MKTTLRGPAVCLALFLSGQALRANQPDALHPSLPDTATTTAEIERAFQSHSGLVHPFSAKVDGNNRRLFIIWNCPYSGLDLNYVFAYAFDGTVWRKFYSGGVRAAPPKISAKLLANGQILLLEGRTPADRVAISLEDVPTVKFSSNNTPLRVR